jgi:hypothetical protein
MNEWSLALKKAVATFVFATTGALIGTPLLGVEFWKTAAAVGIGAVLNFAYRWTEGWLKANGGI